MPILTLNGRYRLLNGVAQSVTTPGVSVPSSLTLVDFLSNRSDAWPIVQRYRRTAYGNVPVVFGFTGSAPTSVQAQVVRGDGSIVFGWTNLTGLANATVTGTGTLPNVPVGRGYLLQIRDGTTQPTSGVLFSAGAQKWGVGAIFMVAGQSNMAGTMNGGPYDLTVPGYVFAGGGTADNDYLQRKNVGALYSDPGWTLTSIYPPAPSSSIFSGQGTCAAFCRLLNTAYLTKTGVDMPIGLIPMAYNATGIEAFLPPLYGFSAGGVWTANLYAALTRSTYPGDLEGVFWHQGEANNGNSTATYLGKLTTLAAGFINYVAQFGRTPADFLFAPAVLGNYEASASGCPSIEAIRIAEQTFVERAKVGTLTDPQGGALPAWPGATKGWTTIDLWRGSVEGAIPPNDALHFGTLATQRRSFHRLVQTAMSWIGASGNGPSGAPYSGRGPQLTGTVSRAGLVATFAVSHEGGTTLAPPTPGNAITGWYANTTADFSGTNIAVTVSVADGSHVAVTFPSGTTFPAYVKHLGGLIGSTVIDGGGFTASCSPDIRNLLYDNVAYPYGTTSTDLEPLGLPLLPSNGALVVT